MHKNIVKNWIRFIQTLNNFYRNTKRSADIRRVSNENTPRPFIFRSCKLCIIVEGLLGKSTHLFLSDTVFWKKRYAVCQRVKQTKRFFSSARWQSNCATVLTVATKRARWKNVVLIFKDEFYPLFIYCNNFSHISDNRDNNSESGIK